MAVCIALRVATLTLTLAFALGCARSSDGQRGGASGRSGSDGSGGKSEPSAVACKPAVVVAPVLGDACATPGAIVCGMNDDADPMVLVCGVGTCPAWTLARDCAGAWLECGLAPDGKPACLCRKRPPHRAYVDPVVDRTGFEGVGACRGDAPCELVPTGAREPSVCSFKRLSEAIRAVSLEGGGQAVATRLERNGFAGAKKAIFDGEAPLNAGEDQHAVRITTDDDPLLRGPGFDPESYVIRLHGTVGVYLGVGDQLAGFRLEVVTPPKGSHTPVERSSGARVSAGAPELDHVSISRAGGN